MTSESSARTGRRESEPATTLAARRGSAVIAIRLAHPCNLARVQPRPAGPPPLPPRSKRMLYLMLARS
jgi:hypothetical protein